MVLVGKYVIKRSQHYGLSATFQLETTTRKVKQYEDYEELYLYALAPAIGLLLACWLLAHTVWRRLP